MEFEPDTIRVVEIREVQEYPGQRVRLVAWLGQARIPLQVDIGFGDAITPAPNEVTYPTLLNLSAPRVKVCPKETVIAEKFQAMVSLGMVNSRMKDFYDIWLLTRQFSFEGRVLAQAIHSTFDRRTTELPTTLPVALTARFGTNPEKERLWQAFLTRSRIDINQPDLAEVVVQLADFFGPLLTVTAGQQVFEKNWSPVGGWA